MSKVQLAATMPGHINLKSALVIHQKNILLAKAPIQLSTNFANFKNKKYSVLYQHEQKP